jgi:hypothetical protein
MRANRIAILLATALGSSIGSPIAAIDHFVDSLLDQIDVDVTDGICRTAAGTCTLRAAVMTANRVTGNVRVDIYLPAGTFEITRPPIGTNGDDGGDFNFTEPLSGDPVIGLRGAGVGATTIDALDTDRVLRVHPGARVELFDLALRRGFADPGTTDGGGCIRNGGRLWIERVELDDCSAFDGGGILSAGASAVLTVGLSTLQQNAANHDGGGIWTDGDTTIFGTLFFLNSAQRGGGVHVAPGGVVPASGTTFFFNQASAEGGALYAAGAAQLTDSLVDSNFAVSGGGATVASWPESFLGVTTSTFLGNDATSGGGVEIEGEFRAARSVFHSNVAVRGGGILVRSSGAVIMDNSTVSANSAAESGGGLYLEGSPGLNVYSSTIAFNAADADQNETGDAGGVYNEDAVFNVRNCLIAGNYVFDSQTNPDDCAGTVNSFGRNLFGDVAGCTIVTGSGTWGLLNGLDLLGPLVWNGGPSTTHALLPGSNAIDGGEPIFGCIGVDSEPLPNDQRGQPRTVGARCDIGAFEFGPLIFEDGFGRGDLSAWSSST